MKFNVKLALAVASSVLSATNAFATDLLVPSEYSTLQGAIDAAVDGDTVIVAPGTYNETMTITGKAITLRSSAGAATTKIDRANATGDVFTINSAPSAGVTIQGFTILRCQANVFVGSGASTVNLNNVRVLTGRRAAWVRSGSHFVLNDFQVAGMSGVDGNGVYVENAGSTLNATASNFGACTNKAVYFAPNTSGSLTNCEFTNNNNTSIYCDSSTVVTVVESGFYNNTFTSVYCNTGSVVSVSGSAFSNCSPPTGGSIGVLSANLTIFNSTFSNCTQSAISVTTGTLTLSGSTFSNCTGSAISVTTGTVTLTGSTFSNCNGVDGGAVGGTNSTVSISNCGFTSVKAASRGGIVYLSAGSLTMTACSASDFRAEVAGGVIYSVSATVTVDGLLAENSTTGFAPTNAVGGVVANDTGQLTIRNSTFRNLLTKTDIGVLGGGQQSAGAVVGVGNSTNSLTVETTTFENCSVFASYDGGSPPNYFGRLIGVRGNRVATIAGVKAIGGGASAGYGDTVVVFGSVAIGSSVTASLANCIFEGQYSNRGAFYSESTKQLDFTDCMFNGCGSGGIRDVGSNHSLNVSGSRFQNCTSNGAILIDSATTALNISGSVFLNNSRGVPSQGSAIYSPGPCSLFTSAFIGNQSYAVYAVPPNFCVIGDCSFCGPRLSEVFGAVIDKGGNIYSADCSHDCDLDGYPDWYEIASGNESDCNANGVPDSCDIASGFANDCNTNAIPDSCEVDSDADGTINACDGCPSDPGKVAAGTCGCGVADTDTDSDGTANCIDDDDDNDGVADSLDAFPLDASESVDTDGDGIGNNADQDDDGDGADDATDGCPLDANKSAPGQCGCGIADTDSDGDGVADCVDNCVAIANTTQADCNSNGIGEACESFTDCDTNGIPDSCDIASGAAGDCDNDGILNSCEIAAGALDCNSNGIPDTCDVLSGGASVDCNANGIPDSCDIASGASMDCNSNAIPDSCDIANGASHDVDSNGIPDECKHDCNNNGFLDGWEIAQGLVPDCNNNGIPDSCENDSRAANTGNMGRFGNGVPATGTLSAVVATTTAVTVRIEAVGDLGAATEYATLKLGQTVVGTLLFQTTGNDCPANPDVATLTLTKAQWNAIVASAGSSGNVAVTLTASPLVDAAQCGEAAMSYVSVNYGGPAYDCDGNGLSDLCEVGSGTGDCNNNSILDACELLSGSAPDIDANGVIDSCQTDCNGNSLPDTYEVAQGLVSDCNGNGIPDSCDLAGGAPDCNANGIIDSCDIASGSAPDCNGNGKPDSCDISSGFAPDCNANSIPDSCDISSGTVPDCNNNGVPDSCDVASGAPDCNNNGVPDSCDVASGSSNDVDTNGVPDECKTDCNANGLPDAWEILQQLVPDCNGNSVPDSCDVADGTVKDCNDNGIPDSCDIAAGEVDKNSDGQPDDCQYRYGDFDLDGNIGGSDLAVLLALWGTIDPVVGDITSDGRVDGQDLAQILARWGPIS